MLSGEEDNFIDKLMMSQIGFVNTLAPSLKNVEDISSIPGALETSRQRINLLVMYYVIRKSSNFSIFGFSSLQNILVFSELNLRGGFVF